MHSASIDHLGDMLIQSVAQPQALGEFLRDFSHGFQASHGLITLRHRHNHRVDELLQEGFDDRQFEQYQQYYFSHCIWSDRLARKPAQSFHRTEHLASDRELTRSVFYNEFARPTGIRHGIAAIFSIPGTDQYLQIGLLRGPRQAAFDERDSRQMGRLIAPLRHFLQLRHAFADRLKTTGSLEGLIDQYRTAAFLLDQDRNILHFNTPAESLLHSHSPFVLSRGRLDLREPRLGRRLQQQIGQLLSGKDAASSPAFTLATDGGEYELRLFRCHHQQLGLLYEGMADCLALLVRERGARPEIDIESLRSLFGLTHSEASIARWLAQGLTPAEIAQRRQVSISTLRTQIKSIHHKLGVSQQAELVQRILGSLAACPAGSH